MNIEEVLSYKRKTKTLPTTTIDIQKVLNNISEIQEDVQYYSKVNNVIQEFAGEFLESKVDVNQLHDILQSSNNCSKTPSHSQTRIRVPVLNLEKIKSQQMEYYTKNIER